MKRIQCDSSYQLELQLCFEFTSGVSFPLTVFVMFLYTRFNLNNEYYTLEKLAKKKFDKGLSIPGKLFNWLSLLQVQHN